MVDELERSGGILSEKTLIDRILKKNRNDIINANILRLIFEIHPELCFVKNVSRTIMVFEDYDKGN